MIKKKRNHSSLLNVFGRCELSFTHGEGAYLFSQDKERYLDFASGIAVNILGYGHAELVKTLKAQADKLWHISNLYQIPQQEEVADYLTQSSFADCVFFTNSGTEAIECAIKMARAYHQDRGDKERTQIISFDGAFHGRSLAALAASGKMDGFGAFSPDFIQIPINNDKALKKAITSKSAAILIEPIQGEGGVRVIDEVFLDELRAAM